MFKVPEEYRITKSINPMLLSTKSDGNNGFFAIRQGALLFFVKASDGLGWEHVSISVKRAVKSDFVQMQRTPTWEEMCKIKDLFWGENDVVIQYHPAKKDYINMHPYVLHLWRPVKKKIATPNPLLIGMNLHK